jgi:hypothetical protein
MPPEGKLEQLGLILLKGNRTGGQLLDPSNRIGKVPGQRMPRLFHLGEQLCFLLRVGTGNLDWAFRHNCP